MENGIRCIRDVNEVQGSVRIAFERLSGLDFFHHKVSPRSVEPRQPQDVTPVDAD